MNILTFRRTIRPYALTIAFSAIGFLFVYILKYLFEIEFNKLEMSVIAFVVTSGSVLLLFPGVFKIPFGKVGIGDFIKKVGLYKPENVYKFVLLGIIAALFTLSGMLIGSQLTGKYVFSFSTITLSQAVFSLTPGIWEEVLFRGVLMILLIRATKSFNKAFLIQVLLFGLAHIKGFAILSFIDAFSVLILAIAFTYTVYKTGSLIPAIIFHYLHDTFLYFVQLPDGEYHGFKENALFFSSLWISIALSILVIKRLSERFNIRGKYDLYGTADRDQADRIKRTNEEKKQEKERKNKRMLLINVVGFSAILLFSFDESSLSVQILISLFVIASLLIYFLWNKVGKNVEFQINLLAAFIAFVTGYDYYSKGSQSVYLIWFLLGCVYLIIGIVKKRKGNSRSEEIMNLED